MVDPNTVKSRLRLMAKYSSQDVGLADLCNCGAEAIDQLQERIARLESAITAHMHEPESANLLSVLAGVQHGPRSVLQQSVR